MPTPGDPWAEAEGASLTRSLCPQFSAHCVSGCICPPGLLSDGSGGCVAEEDCPCLHNEATYQPGDTIRVDCNTWWVQGLSEVGLWVVGRERQLRGLRDSGQVVFGRGHRGAEAWHRPHPLESPVWSHLFSGRCPRGQACGRAAAAQSR